MYIYILGLLLSYLTNLTPIYLLNALVWFASLVLTLTQMVPQLIVFFGMVGNLKEAIKRKKKGEVDTVVEVEP